MADLAESGWNAARVLEFITVRGVLIDDFEIFARERFGKASTASDAGNSAKAVNPDIAVLAALSPIEYDQRRKVEAKRLGVRVDTLDAEVAKARKQNKAEHPRQEAPQWAPAPKVWDQPVEGAALLAELIAAIRRFVLLDQTDALSVATLDTVHVGIRPRRGDESVPSNHFPDSRMREKHAPQGHQAYLPVAAGLFPKSRRAHSPARWSASGARCSWTKVMRSCTKTRSCETSSMPPAIPTRRISHCP